MRDAIFQWNSDAGDPLNEVQADSLWQYLASLPGPDVSALATLAAGALTLRNMGVLPEDKAREIDDALESLRLSPAVRPGEESADKHV